MIRKFRDYVKENRRQPNLDFLGKPHINFLNLFGVETQNKDSTAEITADTTLTFRSMDQQENSVRASTSPSQKKLVGEAIRLRIKCKEQEEKLARQDGMLKSAKIKASSKDENLAKISKKMHAAKEKR